MAEPRPQWDDLFGEVYMLEAFEKVFAKSQASESLKLFFVPGSG
jgi:hypothetical protein